MKVISKLTTMTISQNTESLQALIDTRLDTIDRILMGRLPRQDRVAIVREVEAQIHDMLGNRSLNELDTDDILTVLGRLDPPEAYLAQASSEPAPAPRYLPSTRTLPRSQPGLANAARTSGILGMVSLLLITVTAVLAFRGAFDNHLLGYLVYFHCLGLDLLMSTGAVVLASRTVEQSVWSVVGLLTGVVGLFAFLLGITPILF